MRRKTFPQVGVGWKHFNLSKKHSRFEINLKVFSWWISIKLMRIESMHGKLSSRRHPQGGKSWKKIVCFYKIIFHPHTARTEKAFLRKNGRNVIYVIGIPRPTSSRHQFAPCCLGGGGDGRNIIIEIVLVPFFSLLLSEHVRRTFYYVLLFSVAIRHQWRW